MAGATRKSIRESPVGLKALEIRGALSAALPKSLESPLVVVMPDAEFVHAPKGMLLNIYYPLRGFPAHTHPISDRQIDDFASQCQQKGIEVRFRPNPRGGRDIPVAVQSHSLSSLAALDIRDQEVRRLLSDIKTASKIAHEGARDAALGRLKKEAQPAAWRIIREIEQALTARK